METRGGRERLILSCVGLLSSVKFTVSDILKAGWTVPRCKPGPGNAASAVVVKKLQNKSIKEASVMWMKLVVWYWSDYRKYLPGQFIRNRLNIDKLSIVCGQF